MAPTAEQPLATVEGDRPKLASINIGLDGVELARRLQQAAELWMLDKLAVMEASGEDLEEEAVEQVPGCLLGWRSPATSGEALALVVLAYDQLNMLHAIADPPDRGRVERAYRLLHVALPMLAKAIEAKSVVAKVVEMFGNPAMAA